MNLCEMKDTMDIEQAGDQILLNASKNITIRAAAARGLSLAN